MIPPAMVELLQTGVSVVVGTRDATLMPECTRAWGIRRGTRIVLRHHLPDRNDLPEDSSEFEGERTGRDQLHAGRPIMWPVSSKGRLRTIRPANQRDRANSQTLASGIYGRTRRHWGSGRASARPGSPSRPWRSTST